MTDERIEKAIDSLIERNNCIMDSKGHDCDDCPLNNVSACNFAVIHRVQEILEHSKTQLKELLSALYRQTDNKENLFTIYRDDVLELAKDYGIKESDLNGKSD